MRLLVICFVLLGAVIACNPRRDPLCFRVPKPNEVLYRKREAVADEAAIAEEERPFNREAKQWPDWIPVFDWPQFPCNPFNEGPCRRPDKRKAALESKSDIKFYCDQTNPDCGDFNRIVKREAKNIVPRASRCDPSKSPFCAYGAN